MKKHTFLQNLKLAFFHKKVYFYFYFLYLVRTPINNCAKYQRHTNKFIFLRKITKLHFFTLVKGLKNRPFKEKKNVNMLFSILEPR